MAIIKKMISYLTIRKLVAIVVLTSAFTLPSITTANSNTAPYLAGPGTIQFCPKGKPYGDSNCAPERTVLDDAIQDAKDAAILGISGTIYLEEGSYSADTNDATGNQIYISNFNYGTSLTIQGAVLGGTTTFVRTLYFQHNDALDFTLKDVTASASDSTLSERGVHAQYNTGNLIFQNVQVINNHNLGLYVSDLDGDLILKQVTVSSNDTGNINIGTITGSLAMEDIEANNATGSNGIILHDIYGKKGIKLSNVTSQYNKGENLSIHDITGDVTVDNSTIYGSINGIGMYFNEIHGKKGITIKNTISSSNSFSNIYIATIDGGVSLIDVDAIESTNGNGIAIIGVDGKKGVTLKGIYADKNNQKNIYLNDIEGSVGLSDIEANGGGTWGIHVTNVDGKKGVAIKNANASENTYININISTITGGGLTLDTVTASGSTGSNGIYVDNIAGKKGVIFKNVSSSGNNSTNVDLEIITGNVTFNTVTCDSSENNDGIYLYNISGSKGVNLSGVNASGNKGINMYINTLTGNVNLSNVSANSSPTNKGVSISSISGAKGVAMKGVTANGNEDRNINLGNISGNVSMSNVEANNSGNEDGIYLGSIFGPKGLSFSGITANGNYGNGMYINGVTGNVKMSNIETSNNITYNGMWLIDVDGSKGITLSNITALDNNGTNIHINGADSNVSIKTINASRSITDYGLVIRNILGTKGITLNGLTAEENDDTNLWIDTITSNVSLKDITVSKSTTNNGIELGTISGAKGVKVSKLSSTENSAYNVYIHDITGDVNLADITSQDANSMGVYINNVNGSKGIAIKTGELSGNNSNNLYIQNVPTGYVTLTGINANLSSNGSGALIDSVNGVLMVMSSTFNGNQAFGIQVTNNNGQISLNNVEASNNINNHGGQLTSNSNQLVCSSIFNNNTSGYGLYAIASGYSITTSQVTSTGNSTDTIGTNPGTTHYDSATCKVIPVP